MSTVATHAPGTFCWMELGTTDPHAARDFYSRIFGWDTIDVPAGPDYTYTMFSLDDQRIGGTFTLDAEKRAQGIPSHWLSYVATEDVHATTERAKAAGGTVLVEPFDVMQEGRMAVLQDPTGATVALWEAHNLAGMSQRDTPGTLCWSELATRDAETAKAFYTNLFGWEAQHVEMGTGPYTLFLRGEEQAAGMLQMTEEWGDLPSHWMPYFGVADCEATVQQIRACGGEVLYDPMTAEGVGTFTIARDPQGAHFSIIQMDDFA